jgi:hypothetical protein
MSRLHLANTLVLIALMAVSCRSVGGGAPSPTGTAESSIDPVGSSDPNPSPSATFHPDAAPYAADLGVSLEEATRRLDIQGEIHPLRASLQEAVGKRWAGGWLEHEPDFRFVVRVTEEDVDEFEAMTTDWPLPVHFIKGAARNESEALAGMARIDDLVHQKFPSMAMGWYPQSYAIVMNGPEEPTAEFLAELEALAGVPVRYEYSPGETLQGG